MVKKIILVLKNHWFLSLLIIVLAVATGLWTTKGLLSKSGTTPSTSPPSTTKTNTGQQVGPLPSSTSSGSYKSSGSSSTITDSSPPVVPSGTFVSNHSPGQNGSPTTEVSVCNTTPGSTCNIKFTQGNLTRSLGAKVTDSNGGVVWSWDIQRINLSSGEWQITAEAILNSQTRSTTDITPLRIL